MKGQTGGGGELTARKALQFLERLARDDDFRGRLERDPRGALAELGVELPAGAPKELRLPPKEAVEAALETIPPERRRRPRAGDVFRAYPWIMAPAPRKRR